MNTDTLHQHFRRERIFLSGAFAVLMLLLIAVAVLNSSESFSSLAAQAYEEPTQVISNVIRGMAAR